MVAVEVGSDLSKMVKADAKHDYYADLGCKASADEAELKKAFKKLGMMVNPTIIVLANAISYSPEVSSRP